MTLKAGELWIVKTAGMLSDLMRQSVKGWPVLDQRTAGSQLIRSADSIGANITEGYGRTHRLDALRFYSIARGSLEETLFWLRRARERKLVELRLCNQWIARYQKLSLALHKFMQHHSVRRTPSPPSAVSAVSRLRR